MTINIEPKPTMIDVDEDWLSLWSEDDLDDEFERQYSRDHENDYQIYYEI